MNNSIIVRVGLNFKDGLGAICPVKLHPDMEDHGRLICPVRLNFNGTNAKISYVNKKTGKMVYRESEK